MVEILIFLAVMIFGITLFKNGELRRELNAYLELDFSKQDGWTFISPMTRMSKCWSAVSGLLNFRFNVKRSCESSLSSETHSASLSTPQLLVGRYTQLIRSGSFPRRGTTACTRLFPPTSVTGASVLSPCRQRSAELAYCSPHRLWQFSPHFLGG